MRVDDIKELLFAFNLCRGQTFQVRQILKKSSVAMSELNCEIETSFKLRVFDVQFNIHRKLIKICDLENETQLEFYSGGMQDCFIRGKTITFIESLGIDLDRRTVIYKTLNHA